MGVHVILHHRLLISKVQDRHLVSDLGINGSRWGDSHASVIRKTGLVASLPLSPSTVDIGVVEEEKRLVGGSSRTHVTKDDTVDCEDVSIKKRSRNDRHTLSVRKTLKHVGHILVGIKGVDGVHDLGVVGRDLHITEDLVAILIRA